MLSEHLTLLCGDFPWRLLGQKIVFIIYQFQAFAKPKRESLSLSFHPFRTCDNVSRPQDSYTRPLLCLRTQTTLDEIFAPCFVKSISTETPPDESPSFYVDIYLSVSVCTFSHSGFIKMLRCMEPAKLRSQFHLITAVIYFRTIRLQAPKSLMCLVIRIL